MDNQQQPPKYKIAFIDLETAPILGYTWAKWDTNVIIVEKDWYILSFSVKFAGDKRPTTYCLPDFPLYAKDPQNDLELVKKLREVLDEADVVVAHNGDKFDIRRANTRILFHKLPPPSPFVSIDTLKIARKYFSMTSNRLNDICVFLGLGSKIKTGIEVWKGCLDRDPASWKKMKAYNAHDVTLLELVYNLLKPWHKTHPRLSPHPNCHLCSSKVQRRGPAVSRTKGQQYRFQCTNPKCAVWVTRVDKTP